MENAGPIIRYRTTLELLRDSDEEEVERLRKDLLSDGLVQTWLVNLRPSLNPWAMHGSKPEAYENAMGKLYEFGLRKGIPAFDERTEPFRHWLADQTNHCDVHPFYCMLVAAFLSMTGYSEDEAANSWILRRLEAIYPFAKEPDFDSIYIPQDAYRGFPKAFRNKPLLDPALETKYGSKLPSIHDINGFLHSVPLMEDRQLRNKVETIIDFVLKPEYQKLHPGYGVVMLSGRFYSAGWSVHLPGYPDPSIQTREFGRFLLRLNMLSRSKTARKHSWFRRSLSLLEEYRTEVGLIRFPASFLPDSKVGYWVVGRRMRLEANRRLRKAITCESTFRHLEITMRET